MLTFATPTSINLPYTPLIWTSLTEKNRPPDVWYQTIITKEDLFPRTTSHDYTKVGRYGVWLKYEDTRRRYSKGLIVPPLFSEAGKVLNDSAAVGSIGQCDVCLGKKLRLMDAEVSN
jgi:hypothetical protein